MWIIIFQDNFLKDFLSKFENLNYIFLLIIGIPPYMKNNFCLMWKPSCGSLYSYQIW